MLDFLWGFGGEATKLSYRWLSQLECFGRLAIWFLGYCGHNIWARKDRTRSEWGLLEAYWQCEV